jgi:hypothetical protein
MLKGEIIIVLITVLFVMAFLRCLKSAGTTIVDRSFIIGFNPFRLTTPIGTGCFHTGITPASRRTRRAPLALGAGANATRAVIRRRDIPLLFWPPRPPFRFHMRIILAG